MAHAPVKSRGDGGKARGTKPGLHVRAALAGYMDGRAVHPSVDMDPRESGPPPPCDAFLFAGATQNEQPMSSLRPWGEKIDYIGENDRNTSEISVLRTCRCTGT